MIKIGDTYEDVVTFTPAMVQMFIELTGDNNPIHTEANTALGKELGCSSPVVHGMLAASMFGKVLGMTFPGEGTINLERSFIFVRPVFVGQTYTMTFKVKEIDSESHTAILRCRMKDKDGKLCVDCSTKIRNSEQF